MKTCVLCWKSLKYVSNSQIDHLTTHVQVITRRQTGGQLLPKPMMIQFTNAYMHDQYSSIKNSISCNCMLLIVEQH